MRRCENVKMFGRPLLLEEPFAQTRSGKRSDKYQIVSIWLNFVHAWRGRIRGLVGIFWNWLRGGSCCACWSCWFPSQMYSIWWNNVEPFLCFLYMFFVLRSHNVTRCHLPSGSIYQYLNYLNVKRRNWQSLRVLWGDSPGSLGHLVRHSLIKSQTFDIVWQYLTIDDFFDGSVLLFSTWVMSTRGWRFLLWSTHAKPSVSEDVFRPHPLVLKCHTTHVPRSWGFILFFRRCRAWQKHRTVRNGDSKNQELPKSCQRVCRILDLFVHVCSNWERNHSVMVQLRGHVWDPSGCSRFPCFPVSLFHVRADFPVCVFVLQILYDFDRFCTVLCHIVSSLLCPTAGNVITINIY